MGDIPTQDEITEIVKDLESGADAVNRKITQAYHQLSEAIRAELDPDGPNLDWCGFAKWSSHTVGLGLNPNLVGAEVDELARRTVEWILKVLPGEQLNTVAQPFLETPLLAREIREPGFLARHLDLGHLLSHLRLPGSLFTRIVQGHLPPEFLKDALHAAIVKLLKEAVDVDDHIVVRALRFGNAAIFRLTGSIFTQLAEWLRQPTAQSDQEVAVNIVQQALDSPPKAPSVGMSLEHLGKPSKDLLINGVKFYLLARRERDPNHRAELILAGSMNFSLYEQERANRLIAIGISAPVRARLIPVVNALSEVPVSADEVLLAEANHDPVVIRGVVNGVTRKLTDLGLVVEIAGNRVRLGHPGELPQPQVIPTLPEVKQVMEDVEERAVGRPRNWTDLDYRIGFIGKYFAAYQQNPEALKEPDTPVKPST